MLRVVRHALVLLALLATGACTAPPAPAPPATPAPPELVWDVTVDGALHVTERLCWSGFDPAGIEPELATARALATVQHEDHGTRGCATVTLDLAAMADRLDDDGELRRIGDTVTGSFDPWLWRPHAWPTGLVGRLRLALAPGLTVSLPHERAPDGAWLVPWSTWSFMARFALGRFTPETLDVAGTRLTIASLDAAPRMTAAGRSAWLGAAARAVATIGDGHLPTDRIQVLVTPAGRGDEPVVFGMAMRGAGPSVSLRLSDDATDRNVRGEWIAVHELAHLWLPPVVREDAWLPEGLASYYQCILRSRAGMYDERAAWEELLAGFDRGRRRARSPLRQAPRHGFMQTYWGGAAIVFKLDVALRREGRSLDAALVALRKKQPDTGASMARIDDRPALDVVADLVGPGLDVRPWLELPFADTTEELAALGVGGSGDRVILDDGAPLAATRRAIAGKRP